VLLIRAFMFLLQLQDEGRELLHPENISLCLLSKEFLNITENTVTSTINTQSTQDNVS